MSLIVIYIRHCAQLHSATEASAEINGSVREIAGKLAPENFRPKLRVSIEFTLPLVFLAWNNFKQQERAKKEYLKQELQSWVLQPLMLYSSGLLLGNKQNCCIQMHHIIGVKAIPRMLFSPYRTRDAPGKNTQKIRNPIGGILRKSFQLIILRYRRTREMFRKSRTDAGRKTTRRTLTVNRSIYEKNKLMNGAWGVCDVSKTGAFSFKPSHTSSRKKHSRHHQWLCTIKAAAALWAWDEVNTNMARLRDSK